MLTFASVLFSIVEVLLALEATGTSDNLAGLARLVAVVRVFPEELGSLLASEQLQRQ
jgi:hypothetical protein